MTCAPTWACCPGCSGRSAGFAQPGAPRYRRMRHGPGLVSVPGGSPGATRWRLPDPAAAALAPLALAGEPAGGHRPRRSAVAAAPAAGGSGRPAQLASAHRWSSAGVAGLRAIGDRVAGAAPIGPPSPLRQWQRLGAHRGLMPTAGWRRTCRTGRAGRISQAYRDRLLIGPTHLMPLDGFHFIADSLGIVSHNVELQLRLIRLQGEGRPEPVTI